MNNLIAESIKRFNDLARKEIKHYDNMCDRGDFCICLQDVQADFLKQELIAIAEKTREERLKDLLSILPRKFFEDEDHIVGGYISKKDLYELLSDKESK